MHIVHVVVHFPTTKLEYQEVALARVQTRSGNKVTIVTSDWHNNYPNYKEIFEPIIGQRYVGIGISEEERIVIIRLKLKKILKIIPYLSGLNKTLRKINPDFIICHGFEVGILPIQSYVNKIPLIVDSHFMHVHSVIKSRNNLNKFFVQLKLIVNRLVLKLNGSYLRDKGVSFFGVTEESAANIAKYVGLKTGEVKLIPLGVNRSIFFKSNEIRKNTRNKLGVAENDILLCYTGKIESYKGVHLIIESLARINYPNLRLLIVGGKTGLYSRYLDKIIQENKLQDYVIFKPFSNKPELNAFFNASDIAVYPRSVTISHIEAMSVGLPIIIENLSGVQHRIEYENGFCINGENEKELDEKINFLINNPNEREKMGRQSLKLVQDKFTWENINKQILSLAKIT
ncbi:MAG: glycosyltransferase family 4 protein [Bacteroidales bacterium]|nr:glycosyltransferase family 4 protein [Acholeplasmataceae bacterium]MCK9448814.1 glycosyltransferase family 4 protein [Bacteroidales bacterium]